MNTIIDRPARVGVITDQTGALSFMGLANVNVATMVVDDINARGGVLGRPVELFIEDSATDDNIARVAAQRHHPSAPNVHRAGCLCEARHHGLDRPLLPVRC